MIQVQILPPAKKRQVIWQECTVMTFISYQNSLEKGSCFMIDIPEPSFHNTNNTPGSIII